MESTATRHRVDDAATVDEVVASVRGFVEGLATRELDRLPRFNRPTRIDSAEAVQRWADQLSRYEPGTSQDPVNQALFVEVRECFARASARIAQLARGEAAP